MSALYLTAEEATAIGNAPLSVIDGILRLAAHGLKAPDIHQYATAIADDREPPPLPALGGPRPIKVQLHSFLLDSRQYSDTYGLGHDVVAELRALEASDPEAARERVFSIIAASPRIVQSGRPVSVVLDGSPGDAPGAAQPLANATGINKSLAAEIASNSMLYGSYKYEAFETSLPGVTQKFAADLGRNFFVLTFSKKNAVALARIAAVKGRVHESVAPYVAYVNSQGQLLMEGAIPDGYWDCRRGPRDPVQASTRKISPGARAQIAREAHGARSPRGDEKSVVG